MRILITLALVGCGSATKPPPSHHTPGANKCLAARFHRASIAQFRVTGDKAVLCYRIVEEKDGYLSSSYEPTDIVCYAVDERGSVVAEVPWEETGEPQSKPNPHTIEWLNGNNYKVCTGDKCTTITGKNQPGEMGDRAIVSDDGKRAFVLSSTTDKNGENDIRGELIDVPGARSIAEFRVSDDGGAFKDTSTTRGVEIIGDHVTIGIFHAGPCCGTWLFAPDGSNVPLHPWDGQSVKLDPKTLLVLGGHHVQVVDVAKLKTEKDLTLPGKDYGDQALELQSSAMVQLPNAILFAHAQPAGVVAFDPKTRSLLPAREIPLCDGPPKK